MAPIVGQNLQRIGRKNMILAGYILCIGATVGFGVCANIGPKQEKEEQDNSGSKAFFALSIVIRFFQGIGDSMVATSAYSIVSIEFPHNREVYIGYC
jgi:MFS family permease